MIYNEIEKKEYILIYLIFYYIHDKYRISY